MKNNARSLYRVFTCSQINEVDRQLYKVSSISVIYLTASNLQKLYNRESISHRLYLPLKYILEDSIFLFN